MYNPRILPLILACVITFSAKAQQAYHLFNPVPRAEMRDFSIDRPDVTESPMTVDAGHFQFEGDLFKSIRGNQGKGDRAYNIFNGLYKVGLTQSWDLHVGIELYNVYQTPEGETTHKGYGNTTIRLKYNFWGNDGDSRTALGMIPYVTLPTSPVDSDVTYGVGFPFSYSLNDAYSAGAQFQADFIPDETGKHQFSYLQAIVFGGPVVGPLDFYIEGVGIFSEVETTFSANGGLIYNMSNNVKVDVATNLGLVGDAPTRVYFGLSFRI